MQTDLNLVPIEVQLPLKSLQTFQQTFFPPNCKRMRCIFAKQWMCACLYNNVYLLCEVLGELHTKHGFSDISSVETDGRAEGGLKCKL